MCAVCAGGQRSSLHPGPGDSRLRGGGDAGGLSRTARSSPGGESAASSPADLSRVAVTKACRRRYCRAGDAASLLRHTAAMRLLHADVDTTVIALWLGSVCAAS
jgi:integrase